MSTEEAVGPIHQKNIVTPYSVRYNKPEDNHTVQSLFRKEARVHANNDYVGIRGYIPGTNKRVSSYLYSVIYSIHFMLGTIRLYHLQTRRRTCYGIR